MTPDDLKQLIASDPEAKRLADSGAADMCARRCMEIAPRQPCEKYMTELSVVAAYPDPADGERVMQQVERVAAGNPVIKRILKWLQPGAPGVNFGDARVRTLLTVPIAGGGLGLTESQAAPLLEAASEPQTITGADVSTAWPFGV